jgi:hypothetical protein
LQAQRHVPQHAAAIKPAGDVFDFEHIRSKSCMPPAGSTEYAG